MKTNINLPVLLEIRAESADTFLSPFYMKQALLSGDAADFLEDAISAVPSSELSQVHLKIYSPVEDSDQQNLYIQAVHNTFAQQLVSLQRQNRRNFLSAFWMLVIGVVVLIGNVSLTLAGNRPVLSEVFDTIATVFVWTSVDTFWFQRYDVHQQEKRVEALSKICIEFSAEQQTN